MLEKVEWLSHSESWGQDDLFRHILIAKEAVKVILLQAAAQVPYYILQQQQEIPPAPA